ncbi:MAG: hypothetical protein AB7K36_30815, partial [Chloroflexota bacterium]
YRGLKTAVTASALAAILALAPLTGVQSALAIGDYVPDLTANLSANPASPIAGQDVHLNLSIHNRGSKEGYPTATIQIPKTFTDVGFAAIARGLDCSIKPPTASAPSYVAECKALPSEDRGQLAAGRYQLISVVATAPATAGTYRVTARVEDRTMNEANRGNNDAEASVAVISVGEAAIEHTAPVNPVAGPTPGPSFNAKPRRNICLTKKC